MYVGGYTQDAGGSHPCYWIGAARTDMTGAIPTGGTTMAMLLSGNVVYAVGYYNDSSLDRYVPFYCAGDQRHDLASDTGAYAYGIAVGGGEVYIAGDYDASGSSGASQVPCYWTGSGTRVDLGLPSVPEGGYLTGWGGAIDVRDGIVYVGGGYETDEGEFVCYWAGAARTDLPASGSNNVLAIKVE